jgi:hypothetical protein
VKEKSAVNCVLRQRVGVEYSVVSNQNKYCAKFAPSANTIPPSRFTGVLLGKLLHCGRQREGNSPTILGLDLSVYTGLESNDESNRTPPSLPIFFVLSLTLEKFPPLSPSLSARTLSLFLIFLSFFHSWDAVENS